MEQLLKAGADLTLKMGDLYPLNIATDFDHPQIVDLIKTYADTRTNPENSQPV